MGLVAPAVSTVGVFVKCNSIAKIIQNNLEKSLQKSKMVVSLIYQNRNTMAKLTKDVYRNKEEWAAKKMAANSSVSSLTTDQHEVLSKLCKMRHELHCNLKAMYVSESELGQKLTKYFDMELADSLHIVDLPKFNTTIDIVDMPCDYDNDEDEDEDDLITEYYDQVNKLHEDVENYLLMIDKKYGTNYAPSGHNRIF